MPGFLYFIPDAPDSPTADQVAAAGVAYAVADGFQARGVVRGPDGRRGALVTAKANTTAADTGYWPDRQVWRQVPQAAAWVGMFAEEPPGPAELARREQIRGHTVTLADGRRWMIPLARGLAEEEERLVYYELLPTRSTIDAEGRWVEGGLVPQFETLWGVAMGWWNAKTGADVEDTAEGARVTLDFQGIHEAAMVAIATNYRVSAVEAAMLGLLTVPAARDVLDAVVDWPTFQRWMAQREKKTAGRSDPATPAHCNVPVGSPDCAPDTGPPSPTCGPSPPESSAPTGSPTCSSPSP